MSDVNIYVQAYYNGGMTGFEIIPNGDYFEVARDGGIIATLKRIPTWHQVSGDRLPDEVIESMAQQIEKPTRQA